MEKVRINVFIVWILAGCTCCALGTAQLRMYSKTYSPTSEQGILQIYYNGSWGTICDDSWGMSDTTVACKQLGYQSAVTYKHLGAGPDPIWLDGVHCNGGESSLDQCTHNGWGTHNCGHYEDVGIVCNTGKPPPLRLISKTYSPSFVQGILQIYHNGQWGTICDDNWDMTDTNVACKQLGFESASTFKNLGQGSGPIWLDEVDCNGGELSLGQCQHPGWSTHDCSHSEDVGIVCNAGPAPLRLLSKTYSSSSVQGILQIFYNGAWGTICDDSWDVTDTNVACKQLGFESASTFKHLGQGSGSIWLDDVDCNGGESSLDQCSHRGWGVHDCSHGKDVGIVCNSGKPQLRLESKSYSQSSVQGILQIYHNNQWGTICDDNWNMIDTNIACKQLGFKNASTFKHVGRRSGPIWLDEVNCDGGERTLDQCTHRGWGNHNCDHSEDVGIVCNSRASPLRLLGKTTSPSLVQGILQIYHNGQWGTICNDRWFWVDTEVACKQLGYQSGAAYKHLGQGPGPIWLDNVYCNYREYTLDQCSHGGWGVHNCDHSQDVGMVCYTGPPVKVRLIGDVANAGRIQLFYKGVWKNLCDTNWSYSSAKVICRMAGYPDGYAVYFPQYKGSGEVWLSSYRCTGYEQSIESCRDLNWGQATCSNNSLAGVICRSGSRNIIFRLVSGPVSYAGRLEMRYYGSWKPVYWRFYHDYDSQWTSYDGVCRMMGYNRVIVYTQFQGSDRRHQFYVHTYCSAQQCYWFFVSSSYSDYDTWMVCKPYAASRFTVRLVDGISLNTGRVEIGYSGVWGTVSDWYGGWNLTAANIVCRMLGYRNASWTGRTRVLGNGFIMRVHKKCEGNETSLEYCEHYTNNHFWHRNHSHDVGLRCSGEQEPINLQVRLENGTTQHSGRVSIRYGNSWSAVCYEGLNYNDVKVICRMLGYVDVTNVYAVWTPSSANGSAWLSGVECIGTEPSILNCRSKGWWQTSCENDAVVTCKTGRTPADIRLENGTTPHSGRVRIRYDSTWGTLCNKGLDMNDAKVICRMLGYVGVSHMFKIPGNSTGWLSGLECNGAEDSIVDCRHSGWWQTKNCSHDMDAAVTCKIADAPHFQIDTNNGITDSAAIVKLSQTTVDARLKSSYQFVVEKGREIPSPITSYNNSSMDACSAINKTMFSGSYIAAEVPNNASSFTIGDGHYHHGYHNVPLDPGCLYRVQVRIVTVAMNGQKIFGKSSLARFKTRPKIDPPEFLVTNNSINQTSAQVTFFNKQQNIPQAKRWYQVVVERADKDVFLSKDMEVNQSYITAELPTTSPTFIIGDGLHYHGYDNTPLEPGCTYRVYVKVVAITSNEKKVISDATFISFTTKSVSVHADAANSQGRISKKSSNKEPSVIGLSVAMGMAILALIGYIVYHVVKKKRKKQRNSNSNPSIEISDLANAHVNTGETSDHLYQELTFPAQQSITNAHSLRHDSQEIYQSLNSQTKSQQNDGFVKEQQSIAAYQISNVGQTGRSNMYHMEEPTYKNINV